MGVKSTLVFGFKFAQYRFYRVAVLILKQRPGLSPLTFFKEAMHGNWYC